MSMNNNKNGVLKNEFFNTPKDYLFVLCLFTPHAAARCVSLPVFSFSTHPKTSG